MRYEFLAIYSIRGIEHGANALDRELILDQLAGFKTILTSNPRPYANSIDRGFATQYVQLQDGLHGRSDMPRAQRIDDLTEELWVARAKKIRGSPCLVFIAEGELDEFSPRVELELEECVLWLDSVDKSKMMDLHGASINAAICAISSIDGLVVGVQDITSGTVFFRDDGKPVHSFNVSLGPTQMFSPRPLSEEECGDFVETYSALLADESLNRVQRLLRNGFEIERDRLRAFLASWNAIEILVNKLFKEHYESALFEKISSSMDTPAYRQVVERIRGVMGKGKFTLADKFMVIVAELSKTKSDDDVQLFKSAKKKRDELLHGEAIDEEELPISDVRKLAAKYLRLHCKRSAQNGESSSE